MLILRRILVAATAFTLSQAALSQSWPQRWHPTASTDDEGQVVAKDVWGNVYVAVKSKRYSTNWDFVLLKYTAAGSFVWDQPYNGIGNGDDIPTSIHVDLDGYIYVGGASYGGASRGMDLVCIKYDPSGNPVWPASGNYGDYDFHNGAVRTTATYDEGASQEPQLPGVVKTIKTSMAVKPSWNPYDRIIAITGMAFSGRVR